MTKTRWIPEGYVEFKPELGEYPKDMFACYVDVGKLTAIFYTGKQTKHTWYNRFRTEDDMKQKIKDTISKIMAWEDRKVARKEARKTTKHTLKVGDILYSSWGYEQTNINFYQVIRVVSDKSVEIREISSKIVDSSNYGTNDVVGVKDAFLTPRGEYDKRGLPMIKRVSADNTIGVSSYETAWVWNGNPLEETASGYGH